MVVATRESQSGFFANTATGQSIVRFKSMCPQLTVSLSCDNKAGLSAVCNQEIEKCAARPAIMVFIHDDVHICDWWWYLKLSLALERFKLVGVAGNTERHPFQGSWAMLEYTRTMSGSVGIGQGLPGSIPSCAGMTRQKVELLDGMFLACHRETLHRHNTRFDERLAFHLYDLDFCRQFERAGVSMGTWDFSLIHESLSNFESKEWESSCTEYFVKWGD